MNDQAIYFKYSSDLGQTWKPHTCPIDTPRAVWGPVLHWDSATSKLWLFYSASGTPEARPGYHGDNSSYPGGDIRVMTSDNAGASWSLPRTVLSYEARHNVSKVTANKVSVTSNGTWLLPFWSNNHHDGVDLGVSCPGVLRSTDQGNHYFSYTIHT